jgi:hypothetical protein
MLALRDTQRDPIERRAGAALHSDILEVQERKGQVHILNGLCLGMACASRIMAAALLVLAARAQDAAPAAAFGVTVVDNTGLEGKIYLIKSNSQELPNFKKLKPKGSIYAN